MRFALPVVLLALLMVPAVHAQTPEFRSVSTTAVMLDAPSAAGNKKFIAPKGMPVQVVSTVEPFYKVRDFAGYEGFIEKKHTSTLRTVLALSLVTVRASAADTAAAVLQAERGVVFELVEKAVGGWAKVKHTGGASPVVGFVRATELWGL
jgi:SH3-like domain-containing protein